MLQSLENLAKAGREANDARLDAFKNLQSQLSDSSQLMTALQKLRNERKTLQQLASTLSLSQYFLRNTEHQTTSDGT